jgi:hypothetical protein
MHGFIQYVETLNHLNMFNSCFGRGKGLSSIPKLSPQNRAMDFCAAAGSAAVPAAKVGEDA